MTRLASRPAGVPGRKPAHVIGPKPTGRQAVWDEIRLLRDSTFTVADLIRGTDIPRETIRHYVAGLVAAGYLEKPVMNLDGHGRPHDQEYRLIRDVGIEAPRVDKAGNHVTQGAAREQMWRTMKMLHGDWNFHDLAVAASLEDSPVNDQDAKDYVRNLALAGYLAIVAKGSARKAARYRFIPQKNTGPKPPMVQRMSTVFDPNLGKIVWHPAVES